LPQTSLEKFIKKTFTRAFALWLALRAKELSSVAMIITAVMAAYALSPVDLIPDFIPILGILDELLIIPGLIIIVNLITPQSVIKTYTTIAVRQLKANTKPVFKKALIIVIMSWILIGIVVFAIWR
jgi:uncharacterized membrane protein YkvA (DUF1232 family)